MFRLLLSHHIPRIVAATLAFAWTAGALQALPPAPQNDEVADRQDVGTSFPVRILGTTVLANNSINTSGGQLAALDSFMDGPDVFYSITPAITGTYRFQLAPWQFAPLRSSDRRFLIYAFSGPVGGPYTFHAGVRAPGDARPVNLDVALNAGTTYTIGIDHDDIAHDNFEFTLVVDLLNLTNPDTCALATTMSATLPSIVVNNINGASADYTLTQSGGQCAVSTTTTAAGIDHVYVFTPSVSGRYAMELISDNFNAVLYVDDSCPPFFGDGCIGASDHAATATSGARHELLVADLLANTDYYIFVDVSTAGAATGPYALIIDDAMTYEINEIEPNDTPATATPVSTPLNGGSIIGPGDVDFWAVTGLTGDRVYAWANNGGSLNSTLDLDMGFYAADGSTLIEFDDEDADGADAPIEDLRFIYSTTSPVIAGARMTSNGTHYFRVNAVSATGTVHRYRMHVGVEPATRAPLSECEPNDTLALADRSGKHYYSGVIDTTTDLDVYGFFAAAGDRVFIACDGDPERDSTGNDSANTDPKAFHAKLVVYDPAGDILISDASDANSVTSPPDYPAQGAYFVARTTGLHYVEVGPQSSASQVGPTETYELAIFLNDAAPALTDEVDPDVQLTPDYQTNTIAGVATDADSGVCAVDLIANSNLQITNLNIVSGTATFDIELVDSQNSGFAKLLVTDCEGNTACKIARIDVDAPICAGENRARRILNSLHAPMFVPDNQPSGPGIDSVLTINEPGNVTDVIVTVTIETTSVQDLDVTLISPQGTMVDLFSDRGSSSAHNVIDATFSTAGTVIMSILSGDEPYTGVWLPEGSLAALNGEQAMGNWTLNVRDDSSSQNGGSRLVRWTLNVEATFDGPQTFVGTASDATGFDSGIQSITLSNANNVQLNLPQNFTPGDSVVNFTVTLLDTTQDGTGTLTVADVQANTCETAIDLNGLVDVDPPSNSGGVTTDLRAEREVQLSVPANDLTGVTSTIQIPQGQLVSEVETTITVDTREVGRLAATLAHDGRFAALVNRVGMDDRDSSGLTKNTFSITLDDDAPVADDAHLEPALGTIDFMGLHQPDGRGEFIGNGITSDSRENMMLDLAGGTSAGDWVMTVLDARGLSAGSARSEFRRWSVTLKNPCGPERYYGRATDVAPGAGICNLNLSGATNLAVSASFSTGDAVVDYTVSLIDPTQPGNGTLEVIDCAGNSATVPINLAAADADQNLPDVGGAVNPATYEFEGTATDALAGDTGIADVALGPWFDNLQIVSVTPDPPNGAASVDFVVGLVNPAANGRGYVRVTDVCGHRNYVLVEIDALAPQCLGEVKHTRRYYSGDTPQALPDNNAAGVVSNIVVPDTDVIVDVDITLNITHAACFDIDAFLIAPLSIELFTDIGSTADNFHHTTLDDEAAGPIPNSSAAAPFDGSFQCESGPALFALDGVPAANTYSLRVADDAAFHFGTLDSWWLTIESATFVERYSGQARDSALNDSGLASLALVGATNLQLILEPGASSGDRVIAFEVAVVDELQAGTGTLVVTDGAGNTCETAIALCRRGDTDQNGVVDLNDVPSFVTALLTDSSNCQADVNRNGVADGDDIQAFVDLLIP